MPPARRVSGFSVDSNTAPNMVGDIFDQSNFAASASVSFSSCVIFGITIFSSENSPPFTYGNASTSSGRYISARSLIGVSRALKSSISFPLMSPGYTAKHNGKRLPWPQKDLHLRQRSRIPVVRTGYSGSSAFSSPAGHYTV